MAIGKPRRRTAGRHRGHTKINGVYHHTTLDEDIRDIKLAGRRGRHEAPVKPKSKVRMPTFSWDEPK